MNIWQKIAVCTALAGGLVSSALAGSPQDVIFYLGAGPGKVVRYVDVYVDGEKLAGDKGPSYSAQLRDGNHHVKVVWSPSGVDGPLGVLETWIHTPNAPAEIEIPFPEVTVDFFGFDAAGFGGGGACTVNALPDFLGQALAEQSTPGNRNIYRQWFLKSSQETANADMLGGCYTVQVACGTCPGSTSQCKQHTSNELVCVGYDDATITFDAP